MSAICDVIRSCTCGRFAKTSTTRASFDSPQMRPSLARDVGHVGAAHERHEMVLADRVERDVAHEHHLLMALVEGHAEVLGRVLADAGEDLRVHVGDAARRVEQPLALRVLPDALEDQANALLILSRSMVAPRRCGWLRERYHQRPSGGRASVPHARPSSASSRGSIAEGMAELIRSRRLHDDERGRKDAEHQREHDLDRRLLRRLLGVLATLHPHLARLGAQHGAHAMPNRSACTIAMTNVLSSGPRCARPAGAERLAGAARLHLLEHAPELLGERAGRVLHDTSRPPGRSRDPPRR